MSDVMITHIQSPLPPVAEELRDHLLEKLATLQRDYQKAAEPIIKDLQEIELLRPPPRIFITKEPTP